MTGKKDGAAKKERILQAALRLFSQKGYRAATTKEIAAESGVAEGLLFYYFGGKKELLQTVVERFSFLESARAQMDDFAGLEPQEALVRYCAIYVSFLERNKQYLLLIWSAELVNDQEVSAEVMQLLDGMAEQGARLLTGAAGTEKMPEKSKAEAASSMMLSSLLMHFVVGERMQSRSAAADERFIRDTVDVALNGIRGG